MSPERENRFRNKGMREYGNLKRVTRIREIASGFSLTAENLRVKADFINRLADEDDGKLDKLCTAALLSTLPALYAQEVAA